MKKLLSIILVASIIMLSGCGKKETSVTATYIEHHAQVDWVAWLIGDVDYIVEIEYESNIYICEYENNGNFYHLENGETLEVFISYCEIKE